MGEGVKTGIVNPLKREKQHKKVEACMVRLYFSFMHKRNLTHLQNLLDELPFAGTEMRVGTRELRHHTREDAFLLHRHHLQRLVCLLRQLVSRNRHKIRGVKLQLLHAGLDALTLSITGTEVGLSQIVEYTSDGLLFHLGEFFVHDISFLMQRNDFF